MRHDEHGDVLRSVPVSVTTSICASLAVSVLALAASTLALAAASVLALAAATLALAAAVGRPRVHRPLSTLESGW